MTEETPKLRLILDRGKMEDLEILNQYKGQYIFFSHQGGWAREGLLEKVGIEFLYFTDLKYYQHERVENLANFDHARATPFEKVMNKYRKLPNQTIRRSDVGDIVLSKDIRERLEER